MMHGRSRTILVLVAVAAAGALAVAAGAWAAKGRSGAHAASPAPSPQRGGVLRVGLPSDVDSLDPLHVTGPIDETVAMWTIYDTLMRFDDVAKEPVPDLATSVVPNRNDTIWTVHLRKGVVFHDGTPFNAQAVKFNVQREMDPADASIIVVQPIKSIDVVNSSTLRFVLKYPWRAFPYSLTFPPYLMASPTAVKKYGKDYASHPVGTGPYQFVSRNPGSQIVLKAFPKWWGKNGVFDGGYIDTLRFQVIPNGTSMFASLQSGALDMALDSSATDVAQAKSHGLHFVECPPGVAGATLVNFNLKTPAPGLDNVLVRRALSYAVDRAALNKLVNGGIPPAFTNPFAGSIWANNVKFPTTYDLDKAKQLMQQYEASSNNAKVSFQLDVIGGAGVTLANALQQMWKQIGVDVTVRQVDVPTQITDLVQGKYQAMTFSSSIAPHPDFVFYAFMLSTSPINLSKTSPPVVDKALNAARTSLSLEDQVHQYKVVTEYLAGSVPWVYLTTALSGYMYGNDVHGPALSPNKIESTCTPNLGESIWVGK